jgi:hypothetical protein
MLHNTELGKDFLDLTPKSSGSKIKKKKPQKTDKRCCIKLKNSAQQRTQLTEGTAYRMGGNICKPHMGQGVISRIHKELKQLNSKNLNTQFK